MSSDDPSPKYIFITGGVISSVGKGITTASLGRLLQSRGRTVTVQKLDPYLNVDPGTMSPYQHGEVYVTDDGAETDLDLGHYERFLDQNLNAASSVTMGQISAEVIERERRGDYLGGTIQTVPHVTDLVKERVRGLAHSSGVDVLIVEVGGTVGDIEGQAFLEAIRQMRYEEPRDGTLAIHVTPLFHLKATDELKTKPTQHSVRTLRSMGIQPDIIVSRTDIPADKSITDKLALFCDVPAEAVMTLETASSIYQVPAILEQAGLTDLTLERLGLTAKPAQPGRSVGEWLEWTDRLAGTDRVCRVAIVGKYVELRDAYLSVKEALIHAGAQRGASVDITWIQSDDLDHADQPEIAAALADVDGVIVPGGFGERGIEGEVGVARFALEQNIPYLGLCRGMQNMVIAFARERLDLPSANTTEADEHTEAPVIALLDDQRELTQMGGTMRLGRYPCQLLPETRAYQLYQSEFAYERHRHRWEFNPHYRDRFERAGLLASGTSRDGALVEIAEVCDHPFMLGSQFHPELKSRPERSHPLFLGFIDSVLEESETALDTRLGRPAAPLRHRSPLQGELPKAEGSPADVRRRPLPLPDHGRRPHLCGRCRRPDPGPDSRLADRRRHRA